jgi:hypothetical protein
LSLSTSTSTKHSFLYIGPIGKWLQINKIKELKCFSSLLILLILFMFCNLDTLPNSSTAVFILLTKISIMVSLIKWWDKIIPIVLGDIQIIISPTSNLHLLSTIRAFLQKDNIMLMELHHLIKQHYLQLPHHKLI